MDSVSTTLWKTPVLIGVAGGTASGKSSVCKKIIEKLDWEYQRKVTMICQDSFYKNLSEEDARAASEGKYNFDHPNAFDDKLLLETLRGLRSEKCVKIPKYDFKVNSRVPNEEIKIKPVDLVLVEGILVFYYQEIRDMFNMKLFVDADPDTRLARRVLRDTKERGRSLEHILNQYLNLVKPAYEEFCLPTKKYADVIIPRGAANEVAIDLIVQHLMGFLRSPPGATMNGPSMPAEDGSEDFQRKISRHH